LKPKHSQYSESSQRKSRDKEASLNSRIERHLQLYGGAGAAVVLTAAVDDVLGGDVNLKEKVLVLEKGAEVVGAEVLVLVLVVVLVVVLVLVLVLLEVLLEVLVLVLVLVLLEVKTKGGDRFRSTRQDGSKAELQLDTPIPKHPNAQTCTHIKGYSSIFVRSSHTFDGWGHKARVANGSKRPVFEQTRHDLVAERSLWLWQGQAQPPFDWTNIQSNTFTHIAQAHHPSLLLLPYPDACRPSTDPFATPHG
jgi:hypothetical protein